jgi:hypothetical protein
MTKTQDDYDSPWKEAIVLFFPDFLSFFFPAIHTDLDWNQPFDFLDQELRKIIRQSADGNKRVDVLVKVFSKSRGEQWLLIHIEVQSQMDAKLPARMFNYNVKAQQRFNRSVASVAILADNCPTWRPTTFEQQLWGCNLVFQFPTCKVLDYPIVPRVPNNPFSWLVAAHMETQRTKGKYDERKAVKLSLVKNLMLGGQPAEMVFQLLRLVHWLLALPPDLEYIFDQEISNFQEEHKMPYMTSWERRGHEKGLQDGLQEGLLEGKRQTALDFLQAGVSPDKIFQVTGLRPEDLNPPVDTAKPDVNRQKS